MKAVVAVTDGEWGRYLRERPSLREANFWTPTATSTFRALRPGEPFLFKTHRPHDRLIGGGFLSGAAHLRVSEAWDLFGEGNGVATEAALLAAIRRYRKDEPGDDQDPLIGCILLRDIFFAPDDATLPAPDDFAPNIVRFKGYRLDAASPGASHVEDALQALLAAAATQGWRPVDPASGEVDDPTPGALDLASLTNGDLESLAVGGPTRGLARLVVPRVGQQAFKGLVLASYQRRCAITGSRISPALQAAHIRPVASAGQHRVDNGLLLRSDVHTLFDRGYLGIDEKYRLQVSRRLREDFGNGAEFYERKNTTIEVPRRRADRPDREAVAWHLDTVFLRRLTGSYSSGCRQRQSLPRRPRPRIRHLPGRCPSPHRGRWRMLQNGAVPRSQVPAQLRVCCR